MPMHASAVSTGECLPAVNASAGRVPFDPDNLPRVAAETRRATRTHRRGSNHWFFAVLLVAGLLLGALAAWPALREAIGGGPATAAEGVGAASLGSVLMGRFFRLCGLWAAGTVALYLAFVRNRQARSLRTLTLVLALVGYAALGLVHEHLDSGERALGALASGDAFELQWRNLEHLRIVEYPPIHQHLNAFAARQEFRRRGIRTFAEFHHAVMERYARNRDWLRTRWGLTGPADEPKLKTLFVTNFVAGMWSYGNARAVDKPGCVSCNERNHWQTPPLTLRSYLDSDIACCNDCAYLTKSLLDHEGIENRLTMIPGHVFNEVRLGGRWCIADATCNLFIESSWEDLYAAHDRDSITALVFPHPAAQEKQADRYRAAVGRFRLMMLVRFVNHPETLHQASHPDLPPFFD